MTPVTGVERRLSHQPMHANLGTQPAKGVFTVKLDRGTLDTGNIAGRGLNDLGFETAPLAPAQIHAQQHLRPVLRLGAAGAGLNIEKGVAMIHFTGKHTTEFQLLKLLFQPVDIADHGLGGVFIALLIGQRQQFVVLGDARYQAIKGLHHLGQLGAFTSQFLGTLGLVPDSGILELTLDFSQTFALIIDVKDTPSGHPHALAYP